MRFTSLGPLRLALSLAVVGRQVVGWGASRETLFLATRRRLLTLTSLAIAIVATVWMVSSIGTIAPDRVWFTAFCAVVPLLFYPFPFLANRPGIDFDILAHAFVALLFGLTAFVAASLGGVISMTSFFMVLVATLATLLLGMRAGLVWLTMVIACYAWLHMARPSLPQPTYPLSWDDISFWNALTLSFVAIALCAAVAIFQVAVRQSSELLAAAAKEKSALDEARRVAEEVGRTRAEFIANMSHELRTPLNAIIGYGEILRETAADNGRREDVVDTDRILGAAAHLLQMVNDVLRLSESETDATALYAHDVDALLGEIVHASQAAARAQGDTLHMRNGKVGIWLCDGDKIDRCVRSLLSNAIKFTRDGAIEVRASHELGGDGQMWLRIEIADTGPGIDEARLETLFKPFAMADSSMTRANQGPGLGLAITRHLARQMGGDIHVRTVVGLGSTFALRVPAAMVVAERSTSAPISVSS